MSRSQKTEVRRQGTENRGQNSEVGMRNSEKKIPQITTRFPILHRTSNAERRIPNALHLIAYTFCLEPYFWPNAIDPISFAEGRTPNTVIILPPYTLNFLPSAFRRIPAFPIPNPQSAFRNRITQHPASSTQYPAPNTQYPIPAFSIPNPHSAIRNRATQYPTCLFLLSD